MPQGRSWRWGANTLLLLCLIGISLPHQAWAAGTPGEVWGAVQTQEDEDEPEAPANAEGDSVFCTTDRVQHPRAARIAQFFDVSYEQVMAWFCSGHGFGQIVLALQTSAHTEQTAAELLERRENGEGWGQIWRDAGLIGRQENDDAGHGRPDHAGPPPGRGQGKERQPGRGRR